MNPLAGLIGAQLLPHQGRLADRGAVRVTLTSAVSAARPLVGLTWLRCG